MECRRGLLLLRCKCRSLKISVTQVRADGISSKARASGYAIETLLASRNLGSFGKRRMLLRAWWMVSCVGLGVMMVIDESTPRIGGPEYLPM